MGSQKQSNESESDSDTAGRKRSAGNQDQEHSVEPHSNDADSDGSQKPQTSIDHTSSSNSNRPQHDESTGSLAATEDTTQSPTYDRSQSPISPEIKLNKRLLDAARLGHHDTVREALENGADLAAIDEHTKETALHLACRFGNKRVLQELLKPKWTIDNVNAHDFEGWTPLHSACSRNQIGMKRYVDMLLRPADTLDEPRSALPEVHIEPKEILDLLFENSDKFDVNKKAYRDQTVLHLACKYLTAEVIALLIKKGANAKAEDGRGNTPLMEACRVQSDDIVEPFLTADVDAGINLLNEHRSSALTLACQFQSAYVVTRLLGAGASCNTADEDGNTPLMIACRYGNAAMVRSILEHKPDNLNQTNGSKKSALGCAVLNKDFRDEIVPLLLNKGLKLDKEDGSKLFARPKSDKMLGGNLMESPWLKIVLAMLQEHRSPPDISLSSVMQPLLAFASKEEKVAAVLQTVIEIKFEVLCSAMKEPELHRDLCEYIRQAHPISNKAEARIPVLVRRGIIEEMIQRHEVMDRTDRTKIPKNLLQLTAYHGDYLLVWYLLRTSRSIKKGTIEVALEIAKAKRPKNLPRDNTDTERSEYDAQEQLDKRPDRKDTGQYERTIDRFERTINILENATAVESMSKSLFEKIPERPKTEDLHDKMPLLQQHQATIVDFYERRGNEIDLLRSSPSVYDLVYADDGARVDDIMSRAKSNLHEMTSTTPDTSADMEKPQLRWIHLPANHMDWMEHLTERIYYEKHGKDNQHWKLFYDFAQRSRVELPTDQSAIKFMKPICLKEGIPHKRLTENILGRVSSQQKSDPQRDNDHEVDRAESASTNADAEDGPSDISRQVSDADGQELLKGRADRSEKGTSAGTPRLALYTPYITLGYCHAQKRKNPDTRYKKLSGSYVGSILHGPRSLDRFYYNALQDDKMDERDRSQVVTRRLLEKDFVKEGVVQRGISEWPYITVDQLWVWVIDEETIITSSTIREDGFDHLLVDSVFDQLRKGSQNGPGQRPPSSAIEMSHFLVSTCFGFIDNLTWKDVCQEYNRKLRDDSISKPVLLLYQENLSEAMAEEKELFQEFRNRTTAEKNASVAEMKKKKAELAKKQILQQYGIKGSEDDDHATDPNSLQNLKQDAKDWNAINRAATLLEDVKDIRDELVILRFLVARQESVWNGLMGSTLDNHDARSPTFTANELDEMIKTTDTIQKSVNDLLTLEEDSIKIKESILSRDLVGKSAKQSFELVKLGKRTEEQTEKLVFLGDKADQQSEDNAKQEKILTLFTVVTVVFTPLSFLASFYALNTSTSRHNDDGELEYEPEWMNERIYGISAAIVVPLLIYAFLGKMQKIFARVKRSIQFLQLVWDLVKWAGPVATHKTASTAEGVYHRSDSRRGPDIMVEEGMPAGDSRRRHYNTPA
ncbi:hypothetical protein BJ166DRAFT_212861 [Pestalotiopsis sp. NC0098]|nr:hypothetical protein BJ166DRAFT_212861 [Pestalotiopsis sp. NC0098]